MPREQWQVMRNLADAIVRILVIGRCPETANENGWFPEPKGASVQYAGNLAAGLDFLRDTPFDAILAVFPSTDCTPDQLLDSARRIDPSVACWMYDPSARLSDAVRLLKLGVDHFFGENIESGEILPLVETLRTRKKRAALNGRSPSLDPEPWRKLLAGNSRAMDHICDVIRLAGARRSTVLIQGETGTGKEMVARALHMASPRNRLPMVSVNCTALPDNLLEAELFGHVKGAFTGAVNARLGRFEQANRSTIFLDEIGDMPLEVQAKLLRVLQEREFQRIGSSETVQVDVRVIAATNVNLAERVEQGRFREDLYYRLNVVPVSVAPLRERRTDIPALVEHFLDKICRFEQMPLKQVSPETLDRLQSFRWPGNVRQLENAVEMAIALSGDRTMLYPSDFPIASPATLPMATMPSLVSVPDGGLDFEHTVSEFERNLLEQALRKTQGNKKQAADMLRLKRTTLTAKLRTLRPIAC